MSHTIEKVLYTGSTHVSGGRDGQGRSSDGQLEVRLSPPGSGKPGTNPEQLLGVGWSACFIGAMRRVGAGLGVRLPEGTAVDAEISLGTTAGEANFALAAKLTVTLPGLDEAAKRRLVEGAHQTCPYSRATRGNIDVAFEIR